MSRTTTVATATTATTTTGTLEVPGASLHYRLQGSGPLLLIAQSGEGDADRTVDLVSHLEDAFTVLTYDRRGLSRSRLAEPGRTTPLTEHAEDAHRLLAAVTDEPALMLGCSLGAVIGLHLAVRHPGQVSTLIAHEPVAPRLLPEMARVLGIDLSRRDAEPGLTPQPVDDRRAANFDYFIERDFTAIIEDTLDPASLAGTKTRILPTVGATTPPEVFDHRCATELAQLLGTEIRTFPGGHNGNTTHPRAYAAEIRSLLAAPTTTRERWPWGGC